MWCSIQKCLDREVPLETHTHTHTHTHKGTLLSYTPFQIDTAITGHTESSKCMQVKVKSVQVLVEFQLSSKCVELSDSRNERELMMGSMERDRVQLQATSMPVTVAEEGLLFVWDSLDLAYPNTTGMYMYVHK